MDILNQSPPDPVRPDPMTQALADAIAAGAALIWERDLYQTERKQAEGMA
jgi:hypothetical protein